MVWKSPGIASGRTPSLLCAKARERDSGSDGLVETTRLPIRAATVRERSYIRSLIPQNSFCLCCQSLKKQGRPGGESANASVKAERRLRGFADAKLSTERVTYSP